MGLEGCLPIRTHIVEFAALGLQDRHLFFFGPPFHLPHTCVRSPAQVRISRRQLIFIDPCSSAAVTGTELDSDGFRAKRNYPLIRGLMMCYVWLWSGGWLTKLRPIFASRVSKKGSNAEPFLLGAQLDHDMRMSIPRMEEVCVRPA